MTISLRAIHLRGAEDILLALLSIVDQLYMRCKHVRGDFFARDRLEVWSTARAWGFAERIVYQHSVE